jgi:hypothetical protein
MQNYHEFFYLVLERDCARIYSPSTPFNRLELVQKEVRSCFMDTNLLISEILLLNQTYVSLLFSLNLSIMQYRQWHRHVNVGEEKVACSGACTISISDFKKI